MDTIFNAKWVKAPRYRHDAALTFSKRFSGKDAVKATLHCKRIFFFEEGQRFGGIGETFGDKLFKYGYKGDYKNTAVEGEFPKQDTVKGQLHHYKLDAEGMADTVLGNG